MADVAAPEGGLSNPFLFSLLPNIKYRLPVSEANAEGWLIPVGGNPIFNTQWVQCSYPISGGYGPTPRYIFYTLALFAILKRRSAWVVTAALGSVMTYSATAAVHAVVLVAIRTKMVPQHVMDKWFSVLAAGSTKSGVRDISDPNALWLPIVPMAWDNDGDPVLAIVGTAFLVLLPMQLWSSTFKRSEAKTVLVMWSALLFVGTVCALINAAYVNLWAFPQLRFCPPGLNDTFPFTNNGPSISDVPLDLVDTYYWNRTVYNYFKGSDEQLSSICIYPCFSSSWPLRDATEITVLSHSTGGLFDSNTGWWILIAVYAVVCSSCISSLTVFAIDSSNRSSSLLNSWISGISGRTLGLLRPIYKRTVSKPLFAASILCSWRKPNTQPETESEKWLTYVANRMRRQREVLASARRLYFQIVSFYARLVSPIALLFFVTWIEWFILVNDPGGETIRHVGQWGALVAFLIIGLAAFVGRFSLAEDRVDDTALAQTV